MCLQNECAFLAADKQSKGLTGDLSKNPPPTSQHAQSDGVHASILALQKRCTRVSITLRTVHISTACVKELIVPFCGRKFNSESFLPPRPLPPPSPPRPLPSQLPPSDIVN